MSIISGIGGNITAYRYSRWLNESNKVENRSFRVTLNARFSMAHSFMLFIGIITLLIISIILTTYSTRDEYYEVAIVHTIEMLLTSFYGVMYTVYGAYGLIYCRSVDNKVRSMIKMYKVLMFCTCTLTIMMAFTGLASYNLHMLWSILWPLGYFISVLLCTTIIGQLKEHKLNEIDPK